jgi:hypothetical protein
MRRLSPPTAPPSQRYTNVQLPHVSLPAPTSAPLLCPNSRRKKRRHKDGVNESRSLMRGCDGEPSAASIYSASAFAQAISRRRVRKRATAWLCNWQTRDSLTSITAPISRRFMPRS